MGVVTYEEWAVKTHERMRVYANENNHMISYMDFGTANYIKDIFDGFMLTPNDVVEIDGYNHSIVAKSQLFGNEWHLKSFSPLEMKAEILKRTEKLYLYELWCSPAHWAYGKADPVTFYPYGCDPYLTEPWWKIRYAVL